MCYCRCWIIIFFSLFDTAPFPVCRFGLFGCSTRTTHFLLLLLLLLLFLSPNYDPAFHFVLQTNILLNTHLPLDYQMSLAALVHRGPPRSDMMMMFIVIIFGMECFSSARLCRAHSLDNQMQMKTAQKYPVMFGWNVKRRLRFFVFYYFFFFRKIYEKFLNGRFYFFCWNCIKYDVGFLCKLHMDTIILRLISLSGLLFFYWGFIYIGLLLPYPKHYTGFWRPDLIENTRFKIGWMCFW